MMAAFKEGHNNLINSNMIEFNKCVAFKTRETNEDKRLLKLQIEGLMSKHLGTDTKWDHPQAMKKIDKMARNLQTEIKECQKIMDEMISQIRRLEDLMPKEIQPEFQKYLTDDGLEADGMDSDYSHHFGHPSNQTMENQFQGLTQAADDFFK